MYMTAETVKEQLAWYKYPYWRMYRDAERNTAVHVFPLLPTDSATWEQSSEHLHRVLDNLPPGRYILKADKHDKMNAPINWRFEVAYAGQGAGPAMAGLPTGADADTYKRIGQLEAKTAFDAEIAGIKKQMDDMQRKAEIAALEAKHKAEIAALQGNDKWSDLITQFAPLVLQALGKGNAAAIIAPAAPVSGTPDAQAPAPDNDETRISQAVDTLANKTGSYATVADKLEKLAAMDGDTLNSMLQMLP